MTASHPHKEWWNAAEVAAADLPDLPRTKRGVNDLAKRGGWAVQKGKVRRRAGRGGGIEYHFSLFPTRARIALLDRERHAPEPPAPAPEKPGRDAAWSAFDALKASAKARAAERLRALDDVDALETSGLTRTVAVRTVADKLKKSEKTLWNWLSMVEGIPRHDRLPYLAPQPGGAKGDKTQVSERFVEIVKSCWLTQSGPDMTAAHAWATDIAKAEGVASAPLWKVRRIIDETVPKHVVIFLREGVHGLRRYFPHQTRSKTSMRALEAVQGDYHKFDVFVNWPGEQNPVRAQMIAFSDIYSGKFLAWRLSISANSHTVQLCFGDLVRKYGIPDHALLDNGREFAAKAMTGGAPTRFRFKIRDDDVPGLLTLLGVQVHWAQPAWGQAKPIERAFQDMCARVAKHPAFVGAYTGNTTDAKPENYGDRSIPLDEFTAVLEREIEAHNARRGRRSEVANQRSFNEVFNESYRTAQPKIATEEQQLLWLLRAEGIRADSQNGELSIYGSRYWAEWMYRIAGQKVVARFDPDDLHAGLRVYDIDGAFLGEAPIVEKGDFLNVDDARTQQRKRAAFVKATRAEAKAHKALTDAEIAARLRAAGKDVSGDNLPEADVVRLPPRHPKAPRSVSRVQSEAEREQEARFAATVTKLEARSKAQPDLDDPETRYRRACELEALQDGDHPLTTEQSDWLGDYQQSSEYRAYARMNRALGRDNEK